MVEHDLAKVGVEGPSPFSRSKNKKTLQSVFFVFRMIMRLEPRPLGVEGAAKSAVGAAHAIGAF